MNKTTENVSRAIETRLAAINAANGFETDVGLRVLRGKRALNEEDLPCVVIVEGPESIDQQRGTLMTLGARYLLEAHDHCDPTHPNDRGHALVRDLKRAVFSGERMRGLGLDGLALSVSYRGKVIGHEAGTSLVYASVAVEVQFTEDIAKP